MRLQVALLAGLLAASPAFAQDQPTNVGVVGMERGTTTPTDTRRTGATNQDGERLICQMMQTSTTSRMSTRRVCRTAQQWRALERR